MDSDGGSAAAGNVHGGIQLSINLGGNIAFVYYLLSERELAEAVSGDGVIRRKLIRDTFDIVGDIYAHK